MSEETQLDRIESLLRRLIVQTAPRRPSDDDTVYKDPKEKYWNGESYAGSKFSECPADYLRALAKYKSACAWANRKEGDPAKAQYAEKDDRTAALARAWAEYQEVTSEAPERKKKATRKQEPEEEEASGEADDPDQIPF